MAEENDFGYPKPMASEDFEPDTAEMAVIEQRRAITEQAEISSEHFEVTEPVSDRKEIPPQREDKQHRNVPEGEQRVMRCRGRSCRRFRKQRDQVSTGTRKLQDFVRSAETWFDFSQDEGTQHFLRFLKRKVLRFLRELLLRHVSGALRFGFADPALTRRRAALVTILLPPYQDNLKIEPLLNREELSGSLAFHGRIQLLIFLPGAVQLWFHLDFCSAYRHPRERNKRENREDIHN